MTDVAEANLAAADEPSVTPVAAVVEANEVATEAADNPNEDIDLDGLDLGGDTSEPEYDEVEVEGVKYQVPKAVKPLVMMHQDYTRKTMEVADQRRAIEQQQAAVARMQEMTTAEIRAVAKLESAAAELQNYQNVDWDSLDASDPDVQRARWRYDALVRDYQQTQFSLTEHYRAKEAQAQQEAAKRRAETDAALAREFKDWSPAKRDELAAFAGSFGYDAERIAEANLADFKILNLAKIGAQVLEKQRNAARLQAATAAKPATEVKGRTPSVRPLDDRASTEAWMRARQAELSKGR